MNQTDNDFICDNHDKSSNVDVEKSSKSTDTETLDVKHLTDIEIQTDGVDSNMENNELKNLVDSEMQTITEHNELNETIDSEMQTDLVENVICDKKDLDIKNISECAIQTEDDQEELINKQKIKSLSEQLELKGLFKIPSSLLF